ncbi:TetR family transcriptional regulator [Saccharothrix carnea]|uniref:TetR family transcriptional regulator n=1 Tax=Saccharothrix carnea TaxID=1280637 RepID=A0A2P8I1E7_SACCR|nr:TetR/AcrR family transcriptional regulator [Saccharothrix carnea]PSL52273.1 TetR family transcriptional regulator [Saccharothrix carnea]
MSEARSRLLATASRLFYSEGLHSVGIDRIVSEASVTRATLYRHFPSKDELVVAYLSEADRVIRTQVEAARTTDLAPDDAVRAVARSIADGIRSSGFRGCAFLNAAAEYPDPDHPAHQAVVGHRQWFLRTVTELVAQTGCAEPEPAARHFVMLRDGAMAAGCLSDPDPVCETFLLGVDDLLAHRNTPGATRSAKASRRTS